MADKKYNHLKLKALFDYFSSKGLTKEALAVKLNVSFSTLYKWTNGKSVPQADTLHDIINVAKEYGAREVTFNTFFEK